MNTNSYPPIAPGTKVQTTEPNMAMRNEWTDVEWGNRKWDIYGQVIGHNDSHGLCYHVKHPDGTMGYYDPSELKVDIAISYLLTVKATWVASCEHPGGKRDIHTPGSQTLSARFEANDLESARTEAKRLLVEFENNLPKKREGGLSWQNKDAEIVSTVFSQIQEL